MILSGLESLDAANRLTLPSAAVVDALASPAAVLAFVKIDHAHAVLKLFQQADYFAGCDLAIDVVHDMRSGSLGNQRFQPFPRGRVHIDAKDANRQFGAARTLYVHPVVSDRHFAPGFLAGFGKP